jgi:histidinol-phosphate aminotransferase
VGLLDYYRQFEDMADEEVSAELRARAEERRRRALARIEALDLSETTWHEFPHPDVVAAITFVARRGINRPSDPLAHELREEIGRRNGIAAERVAVGAGASALLSSATAALLGPGDELVTPWPSYPLYPLMARAAGGRAVPVEAHDPEAVLGAVGRDTRLVALCNPNDPTGSHYSQDELDGLLAALPDHVVVLLDEALADFVEPARAVATGELLARHPRLVVFRTFSKAYGLAGMRCGYALAAAGAEGLLERFRPPLGVGDVIQAGALEALHKCDPLVHMRREAVVAERRRLLSELEGMGVEVSPSQANFLWLRVPGLTAQDLFGRLRGQAVLVHPGSEVGDREHVRAAVQSRPAGERLLAALREAGRRD